MIVDIKWQLIQWDCYYKHWQQILAAAIFWKAVSEPKESNEQRKESAAKRKTSRRDQKKDGEICVAWLK